MRPIRRARLALRAGLAALAMGTFSASMGQTPSPQSLPPSASGSPGSGPSGQGSSSPIPGGASQPAGSGTSGGNAPASGDATDGTPAPGTPGAPAAGTTAPGAGAADALASGLGGGGGPAGGYFQMLGDQPPISRFFSTNAIPKPPPLPNPGTPPAPGHFPRSGAYRSVAVLPSVRGFKVSENQSPQPQDRVYFSFNYYDDLNQKINAQLGSGIDHLKAYRYIFGFEKTVLDGRASVGLRMPVDNLSLNSRIAGFGGTTTSTGDIAAIFKYALLDDREAGRLISAGLLVTMPTGPRNFAGSRGLRSPHNAALQPFVGFIQSFGDLYFQGFSAIDVPMNPNDVTFYYNDIGAGYFVYRNSDPNGFLTSVAPTFEAHVNTPLNHRDPYNVRDIAGSYDFVNLTFGSNFQIRKRGLLSLAIVEPVTGPRPFTLETIAQFNLRF